MLTQRQAILEFLKAQPVKVDLYSPEMEVQVNVIPGPDREIKENGKGIRWSNDKDSWSAFRIPYNANGKAHYTDKFQDFNLRDYAEGIGLTGWDFVNKCSRWVGFDFDSILSHAKGLQEDELDAIRDRITQIPWVTLRRSKSGKGFHAYVIFSNHIPSDNHTEHAAIARYVLSQLSGVVGFNFEDKVDKAGGVLWVWHTKASKELSSFEIIKQGEPYELIGDNWKSFLSPAKKRLAITSTNPTELDDLLIKTKRVALTAEHRKLLTWFANKKTTWWWDAELAMLVCHTKDLEAAHVELDCKGIFETSATGKDLPHDQNCFAFPINRGAWVVRRHGLNTKETTTWITESNGWTKTYFNRVPDLDLIARANGAAKNSKNEYVFTDISQLETTLEYLEIHLTVEDIKFLTNKTVVVFTGKTDNELIIRTDKAEHDRQLMGWAPLRGNRWEKIYNYVAEPSTVEPPDSVLRYTIQGEKEEGWYLHNRGNWNNIGRENIRPALIALGYNKADLDNIIGQTIFNSWEIVNAPFKDEYPGNRQWNKKSAQLVSKGIPGSHPTWDSILNHAGKLLDLDIQNNEWCKKYEIINGGQYLKLWIASVIQYPFEPLPYLFFFGDQNIGKSTYHEAIRLLFTNGYQRADVALTNKEGFNGELFNAIVCVVEEVNLQKSSIASERIKDWVTGKTIGIHPKGKTLFTTPNSTHWIQCANTPTYCPIFDGDTRITVIAVDRPDEIIPKPILFAKLEEELAAITHTLKTIEIPQSDSRLRIPIIDTSIKHSIQETNLDSVTNFFKLHCKQDDGSILLYNEVYHKFLRTLDEQERHEWSKKRFSQKLPIEKYPKGYFSGDGQLYIANISFIDGPSNPQYIGKVRLNGNMLVGNRSTNGKGSIVSVGLME